MRINKNAIRPVALTMLEQSAGTKRFSADRFLHELCHVMVAAATALGSW
jgi:hypothetical protein